MPGAKLARLGAELRRQVGVAGPLCDAGRDIQRHHPGIGLGVLRRLQRVLRELQRDIRFARLLVEQSHVLQHRRSHDLLPCRDLVEGCGVLRERASQSDAAASAAPSATTGPTVDWNDVTRMGEATRSFVIAVRQHVDLARDLGWQRELLLGCGIEHLDGLRSDQVDERRVERELPPQGVRVDRQLRVDRVEDQRLQLAERSERQGELLAMQLFLALQEQRRDRPFEHRLRRVRLVDRHALHLLKGTHEVGVAEFGDIRRFHCGPLRVRCGPRPESRAARALILVSAKFSQHGVGARSVRSACASDRRRWE